MKPSPSPAPAPNARLTPFAVPLEGLWGREHAEEADETRNPFQRDRDRIIRSSAFRRLKGKTQVFVTGDGDHYRTRLTHTLEVSQIARDAARSLGLNEDLAECIALSHDLGHPPFGHAGEHALDAWMRKNSITPSTSASLGTGSSEGRFEHNVQSHRIVTLLEEHTAVFPGLNLNREVLAGLKKHENPNGETLPEGAGHTLEAQLVNLCDEIAYSGHDCDDALREKLFSRDDLGKTRLGNLALKKISAKGTSVGGAIIDHLLTALYAESRMRISEKNIRTLEDVLAQREPLIGLDKQTRSDLDELHGFLWQRMYLHPTVSARTEAGQKTVTELCERLEKHPTEKILGLQARTGGTLPEAVKDYVAGMTDWYAEETLSALRAVS